MCNCAFAHAATNPNKTRNYVHTKLWGYDAMAVGNSLPTKVASDLNAAGVQ